MHADHALAEHSELVEIADGRGAVLFEGARALVLAFGHVDVKGRARRLRHLESGADHGGRRAVGAVWRRVHADQRVLRVPADEIGRALRSFGRLLTIAWGRSLPVIHRARHHQADARVPRGLDHRLGIVVALVLEVEKIHAGGRAVEQHLSKSEGRAEIDAVAVEPCRVRIEHAVAPRHEVEVVTEPAQERLEAVTVRVDRARQERLSRELEGVRLAGVRSDGDSPVRDVHAEARLEAATGIDEIGREAHQGRDSTVARTPRPARRVPGSRMSWHSRSAVPRLPGTSRRAEGGH